MNKEIICDKCKKDLTKLPSGETYYKIIERKTTQKKKAFNIFKLGVTLREATTKISYRYCKECYSNNKQPVGVA